MDGICVCARVCACVCVCVPGRGATIRRETLFIYVTIRRETFIFFLCGGRSVSAAEAAFAGWQGLFALGRHGERERERERERESIRNYSTSVRCHLVGAL